jgi:hypothetical protein
MLLRQLESPCFIRTGFKILLSVCPIQKNKEIANWIRELSWLRISHQAYLKAGIVHCRGRRLGYWVANQVVLAGRQRANQMPQRVQLRH